MEPGHTLEIPFDEIARKTVSYYVSYFGKTMGREYHSRIAASRGVYVVTREA